jgi:hypothetical protein
MTPTSLSTAGACCGTAYATRTSASATLAGYVQALAAAATVVRACRVLLEGPIFMGFFEKVEVQNFEIASDAFATFKVGQPLQASACPMGQSCDVHRWPRRTC